MKKLILLFVLLNVYVGFTQEISTNYTKINIGVNCGPIELFKDCRIAIVSKGSDNSDEFIEEDEITDEDETTRFGLINFSGKILLASEFELIHKIENSSSFLVKKNGQFYFFKEGIGLVKFDYFVSSDYESIDYFENLEFKNGYCAVKDQNGNFGFINESGVEVIKCMYAKTKGFSEEFCAVSDGNLWGVINKKGEIIVSYLYTDIADFNDGLAMVVKDSKYGYINKIGNIAIPISFKYLESDFYNYDFKHGLAINYWDNGVRFIDKTGKFIGDVYSDIDSWIPLRSTFELFSVEKRVTPETPLDKFYGYTKKYGIVNSQGILVTPIIYSDFKIIDDFILTMKQDKFGLIDSRGKLILEAKFTEQQVYLELHKIQPKKGFNYDRIYEGEKVGLVNSQGQVVLNPIYNKISGIEDDKGVVAYKCVGQGECFIVVF